jgi:hypothetical protein
MYERVINMIIQLEEAMNKTSELKIGLDEVRASL